MLRDPNVREIGGLNASLVIAEDLVLADMAEQARERHYPLAHEHLLIIYLYFGQRSALGIFVNA